MQKIGIIVNPHARSVRRSRKDLAAVFRKIGGAHADVRLSTSFEYLEQSLSEFRKADIAYIGVAGGDGTLHQVLTRLVRIYGKKELPPIVILKSGTMDNVARTVSLKGKGPAILTRLVRALDAGAPVETHRRDTMAIDGRYGFLFGAGLTANFLNAAYEGDKKGFFKNCEVIYRAIRDAITKDPDSPLFKRLNAEIVADGTKLGFTEILGLLSGTVEHVGMGFSPMPRAIEKDGTFHLIVSGLTPLQGAGQVLRLKSGKPLKGGNNFDGIVSRLKIKSPEPFQYTIDGDLYDCDGTLEVKMGPPVRIVKV